MSTKLYPVTRTEAEWRKLLSPEQYAIMRRHGTEAPGSCALNTEKRAGTSYCAGCDQPLFLSKRKFRAAPAGQLRRFQWPARWKRRRGSSYGMVRTEVQCSRCGSHLGHVFDDGPRRPACATASTAWR